MAKKFTAESLLNLEPNKVPNDARSYSTFIYGQNKAGKSVFVNDLYGEKVLVVATEKRHTHIPNAHVVNVESYPEFLSLMKTLRNKDLQEKYDAISIDVLGRMEIFIEQYVLAKLGVDNLQEVPYGGGFAEYNKELEKMVSLVEHSGYVPVFVAHQKEETKRVEVQHASKQEKESSNTEKVREKGKEYIEYKKTVPALKNNLWTYVNRVCDNILYFDNIVDENGVEHRRIFYRDTPDHLAGSSFRHMPESTELSADAYLKAVEEAIKSEGKDNITEGQREQSKGVEYDFDSIMKEIAELGKKLQKDGKADERQKVIEEVLGKGRKVKDLDESQAEIASVLVDKLKEIS